MNLLKETPLSVLRKNVNILNQLITPTYTSVENKT